MPFSRFKVVFHFVFNRAIIWHSWVITHGFYFTQFSNVNTARFHGQTFCQCFCGCPKTDEIRLYCLLKVKNLSILPLDVALPFLFNNLVRNYRYFVVVNTISES